jgi:hypothetical protein
MVAGMNQRAALHFTVLRVGVKEDPQQLLTMLLRF